MALFIHMYVRTYVGVYVCTYVRMCECRLVCVSHKKVINRNVLMF